MDFAFAFILVVVIGAAFAAIPRRKPEWMKEPWEKGRKRGEKPKQAGPVWTAEDFARELERRKKERAPD